jgi:Asp-tRNA(Asn)/Glu-tRNA(Gln) amidotransferase C subunit
MEKLMPLDLLASIKGARSSEAVDKLFDVIKRASTESNGDQTPDGKNNTDTAVVAGSLRSDEVVSCPEIEKEFIRDNFPESKNGYLVVPKVIED